MTASPAGPETKKRKWWQRPVTWVLTVIIGAAGAYLTNVIVSGLESVAPTDDLIAQALGTDAFKIYDMHQVHNPNEGRWGYVVAPGVDPAPIFERDGDRGFKAWAEANKAVDAEFTAWEMTFEGTTASTVEIVNIVPVLAEPCGPPLGGGIVQDQTEGEQGKLILQTDLTKSQPSFTRFGRQQDSVRNYFGSNKITLPRGEKNTLVLRAYVAGKHCKFRYRLEYIADGKRSEFLLGTPKGEPFEVTGYLADATSYSWVVPHGPCRENGKVPQKLTGAQLGLLQKPCWPRDIKRFP